jgi:L-seryl-tRNA(Ser) seleniumtransferase
MNDSIRSIPQVENLLQEPEINRFFPILSRAVTLSIVRSNVETHRKRLQKGDKLTNSDLLQGIIKACRIKEKEKLQRVINGTGVLVHTNMGRSPFTGVIAQKTMDILPGYCNLEYYLPTGKRGKRGGFAEELASHLTGAEDALIVNNNASSVFLILSAYASGHEAIVSRGELIQIGGGFRIPDIMEQTGARLIEVGTTNITSLADYKKAVTDNTSMIFSVHKSNFALQGFTKSPSISELATLKTDSILFVRDIGSGNLVSGIETPKSFEPPVSQEISQGADLVCFSGDKLIGGPQAGIIAGKKELIQKLKTHPLMRMLRVDKMIYMMLQESLLAHANGSYDDIAIWKMFAENKSKTSQRRTRLLKKITKKAKELVHTIEAESTFGGGSLPLLNFPSPGIGITSSMKTSQETFDYFLNHTPPIIGTIKDDLFQLSFLTILDRDIDDIVRAINNLQAQ